MSLNSKQWDIVGHRLPCELLDADLASGHIPHAYLFIGPGGVGKKRIALQFAARLLGTRQDVLRHPDLEVFNAELTSSIEAVRELLVRIFQKPVAGAKKVLVLDGFEMLSAGAVSALLKTLEEPPEGTSLILITSIKPPKTIISRCQTITFNRLSTGEVKEYVSSLTPTPSLSLDILQATGGSIGTLQQFIQTPDLAKELAIQLSWLRVLLSSSPALQLTTLKEVLLLDPQKLSVLVRRWMYILEHKTADLTCARLLPLLLQAFQRLQTTQMNPKFILEQVFITS